MTNLNIVNTLYFSVCSYVLGFFSGLICYYSPTPSIKLNLIGHQQYDCKAVLRLFRAMVPLVRSFLPPCKFFYLFLLNLLIPH